MAIGFNIERDEADDLGSLAFSRSFNTDEVLYNDESLDKYNKLRKDFERILPTTKGMTDKELVDFIEDCIKYG